MIQLSPFSRSHKSSKYAMTPLLALSLSTLILQACAVSTGQNQESNNVVVENKLTTSPEPVSKPVPAYWPALSSIVTDKPDTEARVAAILADMTLEQKVAQLIQPEIRDLTVEDMRRHGFGSVLNGGGAFPNNDKHATVADWVKLSDDLYHASIDDSLDGSTIPTMWGTDAVHGHNNVIGATLFPHNIGLGAANNPAMIEQIAIATAKEVQATGINWIFAPTVATARDDRWGRTYESYSESPDIVRAYSAAIVKGLQGDVTQGSIAPDRVIATVKHFIGDGGTENGDDQGNNLSDEQSLYELHAQGYIGGLNAGAQTVMASFNSWHGKKLHGHRYLLTDVLKGRLGFDGFVVGDWSGHGQVAGCSNESCPQAINAGLDVYMAPGDTWRTLLVETLAQVKSGEIPLERLDDAVSRVLRVKIRAGLFDAPSPAKRPLANNQRLIGAQQHRDLARQAVRQSLVLLKNNDQLLPLDPAMNILVAGDAADNIGKQSGGWSITWQGTGNSNEDFPGATSIWQGLQTAITNAGGRAELAADGDFTRRPDVAIVVFGEEPYAEGNGDLDNLDYQRSNARDLALLKRLKEQGIPTVSVFISGRPLWINPELNASDAFVAAWLPGTEGQGIADVLLTKPSGTINHDFTGRLSFSWPANPDQATANVGAADYTTNPPLFPFGYGLTYRQAHQLANDLPEVWHSDRDSNAEYALFDRQVKAPWKAGVFVNNQWHPMTSNVLKQADISVRTTDKDVQEDALAIQWNNSNARIFALFNPFPEDFQRFSKDKAVIRLSLKNDTSTPVWFGMNCRENCENTHQYTPDPDTIGQWQTIEIPIHCLMKQPEQLQQVDTPFIMGASGPANVTVSDIHWAFSEEVESCK